MTRRKTRNSRLILPAAPCSVVAQAGGGAELARDFAAIRESGELVTRPLVFDGRELVLNLSTSIQGHVRVELQNAGGDALPGFALADCEPIVDDNIEHIVTWRGGSDVSSYAGRPVRLRFAMADSDLFSLRFR